MDRDLGKTGTVSEPANTGRLISLDQFRGYTVAGMFLVNFAGGFDVTPPLLKHHGDYCSYADTIMAQFFFAVGFAYRLTFLKRQAEVGLREATKSAIRRSLVLILVGILLYGVGDTLESAGQWKTEGFLQVLRGSFRWGVIQALIHIALTGLWLLPVIGTRASVLAAFAVGSALLHVALIHTFYFDWCWDNSVVDGGPLGFLSWTVPTVAGALACDLLRDRGPKKSLLPLWSWAVILMLAGYALSCGNAITQSLAASPPPSAIRWLADAPFFRPTLPLGPWSMSQKTASISYLLFASGFSLGIFAIFVSACDLGRARLEILRVLGSRALAAYILHILVFAVLAPFLTRNLSLVILSLVFLCYFASVYGLLKILEKSGFRLRL